MFFYLVTPLILIFSSSLGLIINPSWSISPFIWVFVLVPIIDLVLPYLSKEDEDLKENIFHNFSILIVLPCILFLIVLIILTSLVKTSTRDLEAKIFTNQEEIKILSDEKDLILLEYIFLSSPERLFEFKNQLLFFGIFIPPTTNSSSNIMYSPSFFNSL